MTPHPLKPGDRVTTPSGRHGRIVRSPWLMLHHALITFDCGSLLWIPTEILTPEAVAAPARQRRRRAA